MQTAATASSGSSGPPAEEGLLYTKHSTFYIPRKALRADTPRRRAASPTPTEEGSGSSPRAVLVQEEIKSQFRRLQQEATAPHEQTHVGKTVSKTGEKLRHHHHHYHHSCEGYPSFLTRYNTQVLTVCEKFEGEMNPLLHYGTWLIILIVLFGVVFQCTIKLGL
ncbi:hypothetical protein STCU_09934 [Strigomonas culicis]|uniref:Uncharacterized protein n=1 Tax=Strigomonas culicis TaxID=28005 RepID=S9TK02_9TRYP|nr:hypothetical protein STCU_09934 [Strigomonas culicis]|eukprot:EPY18487.1 hypothetical protein STCU_09934 [Strigomonas culicis]